MPKRSAGMFYETEDMPALRLGMPPLAVGLFGNDSTRRMTRNAKALVLSFRFSLLKARPYRVPFLLRIPHSALRI